MRRTDLSRLIDSAMSFLDVIVAWRWQTPWSSSRRLRSSEAKFQKNEYIRQYTSAPNASGLTLPLCYHFNHPGCKGLEAVASLTSLVVEGSMPTVAVQTGAVKMLTSVCPPRRDPTDVLIGRSQGCSLCFHVTKSLVFLEPVEN